MKINWDEKGERQVLGCCVSGDAFLYKACQNLTVEHFHNPKHMEIFELIKSLYVAGLKADLRSVASKARVSGRMDELQDVLADLKPSAVYGSFDVNIQNMCTNYSKRRIAEFIITLSKNYDEKTIGEIENEIREYRNGFKTIDSYTPEAILSSEFYGYPSFMDWLEYRQGEFHKGNKITGYSTGFPILDEMINGLNKSHYTIVAGAPGSYKTTFAIQLISNLTDNGKKCGFISLEMTREQAIIKLISYKTHIPFGNIVKGDITGEEYQKINEVRQGLKENDRLLIQDGLINSLDNLRVRVKYLVEREKIDVLFIDYLTLIKNNQMSGKPVEEISSVSSEVRALLYELKIPGVIISQLNRGAAESKEPPEKHHLYGSSQLEKDAHDIIMLHKEPASNEVRLYVRKNRFGVEGNIRYYTCSGILKERDTELNGYF